MMVAWHFTCLSPLCHSVLILFAISNSNPLFCSTIDHRCWTSITFWHQVIFNFDQNIILFSDQLESYSTCSLFHRLIFTPLMQMPSMLKHMIYLFSCSSNECHISANNTPCRLSWISAIFFIHSQCK